ncbi:DUF998 domain-containing protein [Sphaerimonospora thailandensis]|uniref:DUF998 domain-containing protein n=1 Tax=Sphaerimonospora thailandensis TaxID=795644 RepID=A0A8J3REI0_9ACTN|nr:DUF998 domain-containing protein [Sphaerimonospora thailandensis]GIH72801.1 hypothetical protein Mth01_50540 [Sphaerimonospora thailandensis]
MVKRLFPVAACGGILIASISIVAVLVDGKAALDPFAASLTAYAAQDGGVIRWALGTLGLASLALLAGMRAVRAPVDGWPARFMGLWAWGLIAAAVVPAVAAGLGMTWGVGAGRFLSLAAFAGVPAAAAQMVGRFEGDERWRGIARPLEWLALAAGLGLAAFTYVALPGHGVMIGLVERLLLVAEVAILALLAGQLLRITYGPAVGAAVRNWSSGVSFAQIPADQIPADRAPADRILFGSVLFGRVSPIRTVRRSVSAGVGRPLAVPVRSGVPRRAVRQSRSRPRHRP